MSATSIYQEKYRPKRLEEVIGQEHILPFFRGFVKNKTCPHMIFSGFPGSGKTSLAQAFAQDLYGPNWKKYFYETNASDARKLEDVRNTIKSYARVAIIGQEFKIIFLDEADSMDHLAQPALRTIIEKNSDKCRFILSCNYPTKIIDPIKDRCAVFRFRKIKPEDMKLMLQKVVKDESIDITASALMTLCVLSEGSMRKALNTLETLKSGGITNINDETIYNTMCYINDSHIVALLNAVKRGDLSTVDKYMEQLLYEKVYDPMEIIKALWRLLKESEFLPKDFKLQALSKLGDLDYRIGSGSTPEIQLKTYMVYLMTLYVKAGIK